jgi:hypothetical protein
MEIKYEQKYIAFLDVLGFSSLVESNNKEKLEKYFSILEEAFKHLDNDRKNIKKLIISDSIILTTPDTEENFLHIITAIRFLQAALAPHGIWIRGGFTFGDVYDDNDKNIIVGKGYIRAYLLEQQAVYPRVIIDPSILAKKNLNRKQFYERYDDHKLRNPLSFKRIHDYDFYNHKRYTQDDAIFICYASTVIVPCFNCDDIESIEDTYGYIRKGLYGEQKHYHKYLWLKKYFLECLEEINMYADNNFSQKASLEKLIRDFTAL